jgi:hypothetical protein
LAKINEIFYDRLNVWFCVGGFNWQNVKKNGSGVVLRTGKNYWMNLL